ncbi:hypothetical protein M0P25_02845 [archaeon]|nr:hypothetical protein [archaeon]MDD2477797.1 hypothetical protein [Candidatus ainarchaeum sp.]MDD3084691.1 hypothetical protein [Candidatus ainarchaeum sp.]MDD4221237.1 hypothetical protein [Candidatus ainarchaeum sp.]MDD4662744.1 hypothetical protein [Candidatus ainarchaeum sp.]
MSLKNKSESESKNRIIIIIIFSILILLIIFLFIKNYNYKSQIEDKQEVTITKEDILSQLKNNSSEKLSDYKQYLKEPFSSYQLTENNFQEYKQKYSFAFNQTSLEKYNFLYPEVNDYILEFSNLIVVYNYQTDAVKSLFFIGNVN